MLLFCGYTTGILHKMLIKCQFVYKVSENLNYWVIMYIPHPLSDENSWFCWWTSDTPVNIVSIYIKREREGLNPMTCPFMFFQVPSFSLIHSLTCTLNHLLTYPLTHSPQLTYSLTHPLICKLTWHHTVWSLTIFMLNCHYVAFLNGCMPL